MFSIEKNFVNVFFMLPKSHSGENANGISAVHCNEQFTSKQNLPKY